MLAFPGVLDAVVFGIPDPRWGEVVAAAVAVAEPGDFDAAALAAHVGIELAGYKKPRRVLVVTDLERTGSGKVDLGRVRARTDKEGVAV
jgi:fatty-acyl-CoA synthase